jgi:hypothetical protein
MEPKPKPKPCHVSHKLGLNLHHVAPRLGFNLTHVAPKLGHVTPRFLKH